MNASAERSLSRQGLAVAVQQSIRICARIGRILLKGLGLIVSLLLALIGAVLAIATQPHWPMLIALVVLALAVALAWWLARPCAVGMGILILIAAIVVTASQIRAATPPITDAQGNLVAGSIASMERVKLGGVDQWLVIRGRSSASPVLLFLNGGPGGTQLAWHRQYMGALEDHFVVVYWEQPGTGKSGSLALSDFNRLTPDRYTADGLELTRYLRQRFGQEKIYLAGQSWGTMLGVWMVQQHPEWYAAFVGIGQMTNPVEDDQMIFDYVLARAEKEGNAARMQALQALGRPPYNGFMQTTKYGQLFGYVNAYQKELADASNPPAIAPLVGMTETSEYGLADSVAAYLGAAVTFAVVYDKLDDVDLESQAPRLEVPLYLAEGRYDLNAMTPLAERYFSMVEAPYKQLVWFEHSGHNPEHEEPAAFVDFMVNTVLAQTSGHSYYLPK